MFDERSRWESSLATYARDLDNGIFQRVHSCDFSAERLGNRDAFHLVFGKRRRYDPRMGLHKGSIAIEPETIGNLLKTGNLRVPPSQRSYRWKDEHVEDLYKDMRGAIEDREDEYFVGSIVGINQGGQDLHL